MENILKPSATNAGQPKISTFIYSEKNKDELEFSEILSKIDSIKRLLREEEEFFNRTTDTDLTESSIYRTIALECEYRYWMRQAKKAGTIARGNFALSR